jgi:transcriptional regulator GlxA family with amidase domain
VSRVDAVLIGMIENPQVGDPASMLSAPRSGRVETLKTPYTPVTGTDVSGGRTSQEMDERVQKAVHFMESHCQHKLRLHQIAAGVGMSRSRFSALFIAHLGVSPMRLLKTIRMQQARTLLLSSSLNIKEVAAHAGFNDISHFVRDFSRLYGKSPSTIQGRE